MDSEEVALDWGGNEDDEVASHHYQHQIQNTKQPPKDEATLSLVAESLLALRQTSGPEGLDEHDQEDRYSDAVSLGGGGEDDMEQLHAYQSRTHLGGVSPVGRKSTQHSQKDSSERANQGEYRRYRSPSARSPPRSTYSDSPNAATGTNDHSYKFSHRDHRSHPEIHREEPTDLSSFPRLPSGPLALPPKPTGRMKAPFVHPSNPAMMSASSMAPVPRERDRDSGERRAHSLPADEDTPLAPHWETRVARDGSGDQYYYNTKTHESTWNRSVATGPSMNHPPTSGSVKDQNQEPARESSHLGVNGNQQQGRPSRVDDTVSPLLSIRDRHYSPPDPRNSGTLRHVGAVGADTRTRQRSPSPHITSYHVSHVSHRGNDRDVPLNSKRERDERQLHKDHRDGEKRFDRSRSRSPVRDRWRNDPLSTAHWDRPGRGPPANERRGDGPRRDRMVEPTFDGPRALRASSLGRDIVARHPPSNEQSSFRDRQRSPPPPPPPLPPLPSRKRTRSRSPVDHQSYRPAVSQPLGNSRRWEDHEKPRDQPYPFIGPPRDRPRLHSARPPFGAQRPERFAPDDSHIDRRDSRNEVFDRNIPTDTKRQRLSDHPDSAIARRYPSNDDREHTREDQRLTHKRGPLSPQENRTATAGPPPALYSRNLPPRDEPSMPEISQHPQKMPPPPPRREYNDNRGLAGPGRSPRFLPNDVANRYHERDRGWNRDKERNPPPPGASRFGRGEPEGGPMFDRHGPPSIRPPDAIPMLIPNDAYRAREARGEHSSEGFPRSFDAQERRSSQQSRPVPPRDEPAKTRYNRSPSHQSRPPPNLASGIDRPRDKGDVGSNERDIHLGPNRYESRDEPGSQRQRRASLNQEPVTDPVPHPIQTHAPPTPPDRQTRPSPENAGQPARVRSHSFQEQFQAFPPRDSSRRPEAGSRWGPSRSQASGSSSEQQTTLSQIPSALLRPPNPPQMPTKADENLEFESRPSRSPNVTSLRPLSREGRPVENYERDQAPPRSDEKKEEPSSMAASVPPLGMHPERARFFNHGSKVGGPPSPRGGAYGGRGRGQRPRRNSEPRDRTLDENRPSDPPPPLTRQSSLLERISDPTQASPPLLDVNPAPSLRERVSDRPEHNSRRWGARGNPNIPLRDRLEDTHPVDGEVPYNNNRKGSGNGAWRGGNRDNIRGRRGRGQ